ncbi:MAG: YigZ family protein [Psychroflexus sp.]|nr:YigZ family protein [Psychroflexus sp.]MDN6310717.1 YigZ family protein [Psychroflexus sp.]
MEEDAFNTIDQESSEVLYKIKSSKFFATVFPVKTEADVEVAINKLRKKHHKARHFCYAWQLGQHYEHYRANDDGEPSNSAGMPIYGQLQAFELTNALIVVVRYFGGTKLGVGGLISAYKLTAKMAIEESQISKKLITKPIYVNCNYDMMDQVMRLANDLNLKIISQNLELDCNFEIEIRENKYAEYFDRFDQIYGLEVSKKPPEN